ncbi:hypothetical protein MSG28_008845 [Choristoneura fumiferana]|uniref:Uncharacterized protein n=1 Tax=Choristoneura fumiferana TaxID=7141 RepID=A0ACC0J8A3_CHOFU|nr:hypothetical protein MSG28_008845 [Choristoneura fumiferana]
MDDTESTTTSADENTGNLCDNPTRDTLAEGLLGLLKPTVDQLDERVRATRRMVIKEKGVLTISESQSQNPIDRPSGSGIVSEKGSIN